MARETLAEAFYGDDESLAFAHGHTFAGNPLACAAGIAVLKELVEQELDQKAARLGEYMAARLETLRRYGVVREVRGKGLLRGVELVRNTVSNQPFPELGQTLKRCALQNGLIMRIDPSWFALAPALVASESDIDELCDLVEQSLIDALEEIAP